MEIAIIFVIIVIVIFIIVGSNLSKIAKEKTEQRQQQIRSQIEQAERSRQAELLKQQQVNRERQVERQQQQAQEKNRKQQFEQEKALNQQKFAEQQRLAAVKQAAEQQRQQAAKEIQQLNFCEADTEYCIHLQSLYSDNPANFQFSTIRRLSRNYGSDMMRQLGRGETQLTNSEQLSQYIFAFGKMHQEKLRQAFESIFNGNYLQLTGQILEIIDYGCGQGLGTVCFLDYIKSQTNNNCTISRVKLIEPSELALKRGALNVRYALRSANYHENVYAIHKALDDLIQADILTQSAAIKIHIFSNILDVNDFNIQNLYQKLIATQSGNNIFICVSPNIMQSRNQRLDWFQQYFANRGNLTPISNRQSDIPNPSNAEKPWRRYERVFKVQLEQQTTTVVNPINLTSVVGIIADNDLPF